MYRTDGAPTGRLPAIAGQPRWPPSGEVAPKGTTPQTSARKAGSTWYATPCRLSTATEEAGSRGRTSLLPSRPPTAFPLGPSPRTTLTATTPRSWDRGLLEATPTDLAPSTSSRPRSATPIRTRSGRSEEHTSELQSLRHLVCRLLLEKKKSQI